MNKTSSITIEPCSLGRRQSVQAAITGDPTPVSTSQDIFDAFLRACQTPDDLSKLRSALAQHWTEPMLAQFAARHFNKPLARMSARDLLSILNSVTYNDYFARRFLKVRKIEADEADKLRVARSPTPPSTAKTSPSNENQEQGTLVPTSPLSSFRGRKVQRRTPARKSPRNEWTAETITALAMRYRRRGGGIYINDKIYARQYAIKQAASSRYYSPEERAKDQAEQQAQNEADNARRAIKATDETRPAVPRDLKAYRTACQNMHDCDALSTLVRDGWSRAQLDRGARFWKRGKNITGASRRRAMLFSAGKPPGYCPSDLFIKT